MERTLLDTAVDNAIGDISDYLFQEVFKGSTNEKLTLNETISIMDYIHDSVENLIDNFIDFCKIEVKIDEEQFN